MFYVYILISENDKKRYIGITSNLNRRLKNHNLGLVTATKYRRPFRMIYVERYQTKIIAAQREKFLKSGQGRAYLKSADL